MAEAASPPPRRAPSNLRVLSLCVAVVAAMVALTAKAPDLYRAFCQATGFNGTVKRAASAHFTPIARTLSVRFDTNVRGLPWTFSAEETSQTAQLGRAGMAYFKVKNTGATALTGRAVYNLSPESAAAYFIKTQCFCFDDQTIAAGQEITFPVIYYVDPKFAQDVDTRRLQEVTLSYTFYPSTKTPAAARG